MNIYARKCINIQKCKDLKVVRIGSKVVRVYRSKEKRDFFTSELTYNFFICL